MISICSETVGKMNSGNRSKASKPHASKILVIRYRFIGDTILTLPFLRNLREAYPEAKLDVLVGPVSGQVLEGSPYVDELITFDTTRFHKYDSGSGKAKSYWSYLLDIRKRKYDLVFVLKRSLSSAFLAFASGASERVGYATEGRSLLLTRAVPWNTDIHEVDSLNEIIEATGIEATHRIPDAYISPDETESIRKKIPALNGPGSKVLIHAAAAHPDKTYPLDRWAHIVRTLKEKHGLSPFFTGAEADRATYSEIETLSGVQGVNVAGELSLRESMSLYKEMDLAVCVDSGPAHLAASTGTPTVTLFGPTDPVRWSPLGLNCKSLFDDSLSCRPCHYKKTCTNRECLTEFPPERVLETCEQVLDRVRASS